MAEVVVAKFAYVSENVASDDVESAIARARVRAQVTLGAKATIEMCSMSWTEGWLGTSWTAKRARAVRPAVAAKAAKPAVKAKKRKAKK